METGNHFSTANRIGYHSGKKFVFRRYSISVRPVYRLSWAFSHVPQIPTQYLN